MEHIARDWFVSVFRVSFVGQCSHTVQFVIFLSFQFHRAPEKKVTVRFTRHRVYTVHRGGPTVAAKVRDFGGQTC